MAGYDLRGRTALVTGGSSKIGRVVCRYLAREGVNLVIHYHKSRDAAFEVVNEAASYGVKAWLINADLQVRGEAEWLIDEAFKVAGNVGFLINNASTYPKIDIFNMSIDDVDRTMMVNAWAPLILTLKFAERAREGKVVNILDSVTEGYHFQRYPYYLSKHMLEVITRSLALRLTPRILVNAVAPGAIMPAVDESMENFEKVVSQIPLKRPGRPEDVAEAVLFLLKSGYIIGQVIYVDGGEHLVHRVVFSEL